MLKLFFFQSFQFCFFYNSVPPQLVEIHQLGTTFVKATVNKQSLFWLQSTQQAGLTSQITLLETVITEGFTIHILEFYYHLVGTKVLG